MSGSNLVIWGTTDEAGEFEFLVNYPEGDWVESEDAGTDEQMEETP